MHPAPTPPAPLWRRAAARIADALTVFFTLWALVVVGVLGFIHDVSDAVSPSPWGRAFAVTMLYTVAVTAYDVVFVYWDHGQTPGKDLFKVRVVAAIGGESVTFSQALLRALGPGLVWLVPPVWLGALCVAGTGVPAFSTRRQALHDLLARTVVVFYDRTREVEKPPGGQRPRRRQQLSSRREEAG